MTQTGEGFYEVSAEWMAACGYGNEARVFPVERSWMAGGWPIIAVRLDNGREWVIMAAWRGRFV